MNSPAPALCRGGALLPQPCAAVMCCEAGVPSAALLLQTQRRVTSPPSRSVRGCRNSRLHVAAAGLGREHLEIFFFITREPIKTPLRLFAFYLNSLIHLIVRQYFFCCHDSEKRKRNQEGLCGWRCERSATSLALHSKQRRSRHPARSFARSALKATRLRHPAAKRYHTTRPLEGPACL